MTFGTSTVAAKVKTSRALSIDVDIYSDAFLSDPYRYHDLLRDAGPVFRLPSYGVYGMARHAQVSAALADHASFCSGRGVGLADFAHEDPWRPPSLLLETDPPVHDRTRGLMNRVVNLPALKAVRPAWQESAEHLADELVARRHVDAITDVAETYPLAVFPDTIGLPEDGRHLLLDYAAATFNAFGPPNTLSRETEARAIPAAQWVAKACRRGSLRPGGWGSRVFEAADAGACTEQEAERLVRSLLSAGVDTTVTGIGNMLHAFVRHPDQWQRLRDDPSLIKRSFEEALRWDSTVQIFLRTTTREVEVEDRTIPEGAKVVLFLGSANRDPRRWPDPDRFDIARSASGHVGFGFGIHQCLGQMLARQEAELLLTALARRVAELRLTGEPVRRLNNTLHAFASVPVELIPA